MNASDFYTQQLLTLAMSPAMSGVNADDVPAKAAQMYAAIRTHAAVAAETYGNPFSQPAQISPSTQTTGQTIVPSADPNTAVDYDTNKTTGV